MMQGESSGTDKVQNVTTVMGGKIYMLSEIKAIEYFGEVGGCCVVCGVNVDVEITKWED